jgi:hypothetical protein
MIRFRTTVFVFALIGVLVAGAQTARADDDERGGGGSFSVRDVQGPTAFAFDGFVNVGTATAPVFAPAASIGRFVADGRGRLTDGVRTLSIGGVPSQQTFECTYTVNPNGTGHADCDVVGGPLPRESFDFVIVERKQRAFFTGTTPGVTIRGETKRQQ